MQRNRGVDLPVDRNGNTIHIDDYMAFDDGIVKIGQLTYLGDGDWIASDEAGEFISDNLSVGIIVDENFVFSSRTDFLMLKELCLDMYALIHKVCKEYPHLLTKSRVDNFYTSQSMPDVAFAERMRELGIEA